jgi:plastocyanin
MDPRRRALLSVPLLILAAAPPARAAPRVHVIRLANMAFGPAPAGLRVGDVVEWVNADLFQHTATARNHAFDVDLKPGAKARTALKAPGKIDFYCRYHPGMTGRLVVAA